MSSVHSYDANEVAILFAMLPVGDIAEGTFVEISYNNDLHKRVRGCNGESALYLTGDLSAKIKITVLPNSYANLLFTSSMITSRATKIGAFPLIITDLNTLTTHVSQGAWVVRPPQKVYARDAEALEWEFETHELEPIYGHNPFNGGLLG